MMLDFILLMAFILVSVVQFVFSFMPLGNEDSTVRRLPWVTFSIIGLCILIYFGALPLTARQDEDQARTFTELTSFLTMNKEILGDEEVREKLKHAGLFSVEMTMIEDQMAANPQLQERYRIWLAGSDAQSMKGRFNTLFKEFKSANEDHFFNKFGISQRGKWKPYQFVTYAFVHANSRALGLILPLHLLFNMIAFFAVGFSLEDLWGRGIFAAFYLLGAVVSAVPDALGGVGLIGASGAVSATMGAFLIRLPKTRLKIGWFSLPLALPLMTFGKRPYGIVHIPGYVFLAFFFINQLLLWWFFNYRLGTSTGVSYKCHIAGFAFGMGVALLIKAAQTEEKYIHPKIEAKVSFSATPAVTQSLELCDSGDIGKAEWKLKSYLSRNPEDVSALMALIQVYQRSMDYAGMNSVYSQLIRFHLARRDKEAALYTYDSLLSSFPDEEINISIPVRDWLSICEYLREIGMTREASVEYERLVSAHPDDHLTLRACVQGGECASNARDFVRALRLFEKARSMNPPGPLSKKVEAGIENCRPHIFQRPQPKPALEPIMREVIPPVDDDPEIVIGQILK
ncbi:MAG TPA: rhomboid family intramembrane serine protease [Blastocatellia bacterium]|jgi:membrane associated rhomboid family serine protease|nr:rhomboid family intramembrane serine protease [Blastocatellia bacterium]